jgi:hypothetical protein
MSTLHAKVTAHKGILVITLVATKSIPNECHLSLDNPGCIGQVIMDTKRHLGVSKQAMALLKTVRRSHDDIGDVDWFKTGNKYAFGWLGGMHVLKNPKTIEGSSQYEIGDYVEIANDVPDDAKAAVGRLTSK